MKYFSASIADVSVQIFYSFLFFFFFFYPLHTNVINNIILNQNARAWSRPNFLILTGSRRRLSWSIAIINYNPCAPNAWYYNKIHRGAPPEIIVTVGSGWRRWGACRLRDEWLRRTRAFYGIFNYRFTRDAAGLSFHLISLSFDWQKKSPNVLRFPWFRRENCSLHNNTIKSPGTGNTSERSRSVRVNNERNH